MMKKVKVILILVLGLVIVATSYIISHSDELTKRTDEELRKNGWDVNQKGQ